MHEGDNLKLLVEEIIRKGEGIDVCCGFIVHLSNFSECEPCLKSCRW